MKRLILLLAFIIVGIQLFSQSAKTEYVPMNMDFKDGRNEMNKSFQSWRPKALNPSAPIINQNQNISRQQSNNALAGITYTYSKAEVFEKEESKSTSYKFESTVTISPDVFDVFLNNQYFQTKIVSRYWEENVLVFKTLLPDNTVVTYKQLVADGNKELIIEFPEMIIVLGK